jgi:hypothetical protein
MEKTKDELIRVFKQLCSPGHEPFATQRKKAVEDQYQRNIWQLNIAWLGILRIGKSDKALISLFPIQTTSPIPRPKICFEITGAEYEELRLLYFGDFVETIHWYDGKGT